MAASKRGRRFNYAVNNKRKKNSAKVFQAVKHFETLKKRVEKEGETKWILNAFEIVGKKLKKYGINTK